MKLMQQFTVSAKLTKQYILVQEADVENEIVAHNALIEKAKADGVVEWCFLEKRTEYDLETGKRIVLFSMLANPFHTLTNKESET